MRKSTIKEEVKKRELFNQDPSHVKMVYSGIAALALLPIALLFLVNIWFDIGYTFALIPGFVLAGISIFIVGRFMPSRTEKGSEALSYVMGYKEYMDTAEADEIKMMTPERFQENLPYAMVLGVSDKWARKFQGIFTEPPDWYRTSYMGSFSTVYLAGSLINMQGSLNSTLTSSPSSGGGGGGGGFGGGFSGGGFGGGGSRAG